MSVTFKRDHRLFLTIVYYTVCPPPYKFYVIYLTYPSSLTRIHIMSTIPVLVHPHQHHRRQDALDILELGLLLALELLGTNFSHVIPLDIQGPPALDPSSPSGLYMEGLQVFNQDNHYISYPDVG